MTGYSYAMPRRSTPVLALVLGAALAPVAGCTPTVRVEVAPINIYAKLDANVQLKLDKEVQTLMQQNPNLF